MGDYGPPTKPAWEVERDLRQRIQLLEWEISKLRQDAKDHEHVMASRDVAVTRLKNLSEAIDTYLRESKCYSIRSVRNIRHVCECTLCALRHRVGLATRSPRFGRAPYRSKETYE